MSADSHDPKCDLATRRAAVIAYHHRTKHHFGRYAAGPEMLDWDDQPAAFRHYGDIPRIVLPLATDAVGPTFAEVADGRVNSVSALNLVTLGRLFAASFAISAWKRHGASRWALRCNPSSGNLHPTEVYLVSRGLPDLPPGMYHYSPEDHSLHTRSHHAAEFSHHLAPCLPSHGVLIGLSSIAWREAWKYGERAWRYCQLDMGHALAALRYAAASLGWRAMPLHGWADTDIAALLGLDRGEFPVDEPERPELLVAIGPGVSTDRAVLHDTPPPELSAWLAGQTWYGTANRLSPVHDHAWELVDQTAMLAEYPASAVSITPPTALPPVRAHTGTTDACELIRRRRSAQQMDGVSRIGLAEFLRLLDHLLVRESLPPWGPSAQRPLIHLLLFVHRVDDLPAGLYMLTRHDQASTTLRTVLRPEFVWERVPDCPPHLELHRLLAARTEATATDLACRQTMAGNGAFCVAMLGEFSAALEPGPWGYRTLLREAGMLGQVLYLEAEALGLQGTGIGCFFDDALHDLLGLGDERFQVVYQFTVGRAIVDTRIADEPAYPGLSL